MDLRLGRRATFPFDDMGPLGVNLVNGNLVAAVGGPSFGTVGPPVGIGLAYNSQTPVLHGLTGDYHHDADSDGVLESTDPRLVRRIDRQVNFNWAGGSPQPAVLPADGFSGRVQLAASPCPQAGWMCCRWPTGFAAGSTSTTTSCSTPGTARPTRR